jgi:peptidoglycan/xylan/chitin deacetylase (PgdA/CDA1 family)
MASKMRNLFLKTLLNGLYFSGIQGAFAFWTGGIGAILTLHHVRENDNSQFAPNRHMQITPKFLDRVLTKLTKFGFELVSLDQLYHRYEENVFDPNAKLIAVAMADGYRDNLHNAVPILRKHDAPYAIFVTPGLIDARADLWWEDLSAIIAKSDQIRVPFPRGHYEFDVSTLRAKYKVFSELLAWLTTKVSEEEQRKIVRELAWMYKIDTNAHSKQQLMNWGEINILAKDPLCTIGAQTIHHYAVSRLNAQDATWEMRESANILNAELGYMPEHFAFPNVYGEIPGPRDYEIAKELGFKTALTNRHGVLRKLHGRYLTALPHIGLNGNFQSMRYVDTLLSGLPALMQNRGLRIRL